MFWNINHRNQSFLCFRGCWSHYRRSCSLHILKSITVCERKDLVTLKELRKVSMRIRKTVLRHYLFSFFNVVIALTQLSCILLHECMTKESSGLEVPQLGSHPCCSEPPLLSSRPGQAYGNIFSTTVRDSTWKLKNVSLSCKWNTVPWKKFLRHRSWELAPSLPTRSMQSHQRRLSG